MARILLADDDETVRKVTVRLLEAHGYSVGQADNGARALRALAAEPWDLLITDIYMPEMDGLELIRACQAEYPALPVIALSGGDSDGQLFSLQAADRLGALLAVQKPYETAELVRAIEQCLASAAGD